MKKNVVMIVLLIILFTFGIFMYDFSDALSNEIVDNEWYYIENDDIYKISFKDNKFVYLKNNIVMADYEDCDKYHYNSNNNVIKLGCSNKKSYIASYTNDTLTMTIDKEERIYKSSLQLAHEFNFKKENNLTDSDYANIIDIDLEKYNKIGISELNKLYKGKKAQYVAIIRNYVNYENVFNVMALTNIIENSSKKISLIMLDELEKEDLNKLNKYSKIDDYNNDEILIYEVGNKKFNLKKTLHIEKRNEINEHVTI